jgi:multicomponent Na+:H+ antiporter subunit F
MGLIFTFVRLLRGPSLPDRVLALDLFTVLALGFIAVFAIRTGFALYLDLAIALGLVGFLSTVALARYLLQRGRSGGEK